MLSPSELSEMLARRGLGLHGPTYQGWAWFECAENTRRLIEAGRPGDYTPHPAACSGFFLQAEDAAADALLLHVVDRRNDRQ